LRGKKGNFPTNGTAMVINAEGVPKNLFELPGELKKEARG